MRSDVRNKVNALFLMTVQELSEVYLNLIGEIPYSAHKQRLIRKIAWAYQCDGIPPISTAALKRAKKIAKSTHLRTVPPKEFRTENSNPDQKYILQPGVVLVRQYRGKRYEVAVKERGFELNGKFYKSISAVAKAITGTHWNGRKFFGLQ